MPDKTSTPEVNPERPKWQHQPGDRYVCIAMWIVGNPEAGFHTERCYYAPSQGSIEQAWRKGLRELDRSDDFNVGVIRDGKLVAILWQDEVVDDEPALMAEIAEQVGL